MSRPSKPVTPRPHQKPKTFDLAWKTRQVRALQLTTTARTAMAAAAEDGAYEYLSAAIDRLHSLDDNWSNKDHADVFALIAVDLAYAFGVRKPR